MEVKKINIERSIMNVNVTESTSRNKEKEPSKVTTNKKSDKSDVTIISDAHNDTNDEDYYDYDYDYGDDDDDDGTDGAAKGAGGGKGAEKFETGYVTEPCTRLCNDT